MDEVLVKSVKKALTILTILTTEDLEDSGFTLTELAKKMDLRLTTIHNILKTMIACRYIEQREDGKYYAGYQTRVISRNDNLRLGKLQGKVKPLLEDLSSVLLEGVNFTILNNGTRIVVAYKDADVAIQVDDKYLNNQTIYDLPTSRILLAWANSDEQNKFMEINGFPKEKWDNIDNINKLNKSIKSIKEIGYCEILDELSGVANFAFPVLDKNDSLIGALGSYMPKYRCNKTKEKQILKEMKKTANKLTNILK